MVSSISVSEGAGFNFSQGPQPEGTINARENKAGTLTPSTEKGQFSGIEKMFRGCAF